MDYLVELTTATQEFMLDRYRRGVGYSPTFDDCTAWYADAWEYEDLYAIYNCDLLDPCPEHAAHILAHHPEWILHGEDEYGQPIPMYIPIACEASSPSGPALPSCAQYAADIGNPEFRQFWIDTVTANLLGAEKAGFGYRGIFVDDVNFDLPRSVVRVLAGDAEGSVVNLPGNPIDPRTGSIMTGKQWRGYMAEFIEEIRAAFPFKEIVLNPVWYHSDANDPFWLRALAAADIINFERGLLDNGFTSGWGNFGVARFLAMNDRVHQQNRRLTHYIRTRSVEDYWDPFDSLAAGVVTPFEQQEKALEYALAGWLLVSDGRDFFGSELRALPDDLWSGFEIDLGSALEGRTYDPSSGIYRREFQHGVVLLREPVAARDAVVVDLGEPYIDPKGEIVSGVALVRRSAAVLRHLTAQDFEVPTQ
ncbi:MAG: putative glycoside hydrolase family 15 protein [Planctomycetes bacterium]|nr:putative glycoside hydrolase family 15 protein [Planctomycetota bacterium]